MPILLIIVAALVIAAGVNGRQDELAKLAKEDFAPSDGSASFIVWVVVLFFIGAIGYVKELKPFSNAFLGLVILVLFLTNGNPDPKVNPGGGFFAKFTEALNGLSQKG